MNSSAKTTNNLIELGGSVNLIATAICDFDTPTKHYKEGEVVLNLPGLSMQVTTTDKSSRASTNLMELDYATLNLSTLQSQYVPMEEQIYSLLGSIEEDQEIVCIEKLECQMEGVILPKEFLDNDSSVSVQGIDNFRIESDNDRKISFIYSSDFKKDEVYCIQYIKKIKGKSILLESFETDIPYLRLQLEIRGHVDKQKSNAYLLVDKTRLHFIPIMQFTDDGVTHCTLRFTVINSDKKPRMVM